MADKTTVDMEQCPACGNTTFRVTMFPAETASVWCAECENRVLLTDLREAHPDSRWYDGTDT